ncbi:MAG: YIP1 family protein [Anaerolineae bacterium]|nr:YIP1 family protein [Anaerolineae bacterium]
MDRIMGVLTLKAPVYRQIAEDSNATSTAAIIVAVVSLISGVVGAIVVSTIGNQLPATPGGISPTNPIMYAIQTIVLGFIGWGVGSWVMGFVGNMLGGKTNTGEMLRVFGFASIFNLLGIIPCLGLIGWILGIIATVIGIREAAEVSTGKAVAIGVIGFVAILIVSVVIGIVLGLILGPFGLIG